jgi:hypothetical protein
MLKKSLTDSWSFFKNHAVALSIIILPIVTPVDIFIALYQYFFTSEEFFLYEQIVPMAIGFIAYPIYSVSVVFYIASIISGGSFDTKTLWKLGVKFWLPYTILSILIVVAMVCGFILLIIPGIIFLGRYAFSEFDLLLNQSKPLEAMKNSWKATKEYIWVILGGYAVITMALYVPYYLIASLFDESNIFYWVLDTVLNIVYSVFGVLYTIFAFRVYDSANSLNNQPPIQNTP